MKLSPKQNAILAITPLFMALLLAPSQLHAAEQRLCPIMIDDEADPEESVMYKGKKIFMCCGSCAKAWNTNPDYYAAVVKSMKKEILPQLKDVEIPKVKLMPQRFCPIRPGTLVTPKSPSVTYQGQKIYFFKKSDISRKWNKDPEMHFKRAFKAGLLPQFKEKKS